MPKTEQEQPVEAAPATSRAAWRRPEVDRVIAGEAGGSADISSDGVDLPS